MCNRFFSQREGAKRTLKRYLRPFVAPVRRYVSTPRAGNVYSTHIPILIGLSRMREIKRVLEFGCGYYSTLTFLNRAAFPHLERLQSVENDGAWAHTLRDSVKGDQRWMLNLVDGEIADSVTSLDLEAFDLIMIDDSQTSAQRSLTIRAITAMQPQRPWIVIHDFEIEEYRRAAAGFKHRHVFKAFNPETGVLSNHVTHWKSLDRTIRSNKMLDPDRTVHWIRVLSASSAAK